MARMNETHVESRREHSTLAGIGALLWRLIRLPAYAILVICEPILRIGLTTFAVLGIVAAVVLELSGSAPRFPFWGAMLFFGCCGALPMIYRAVLRLLSP